MSEKNKGVLVSDGNTFNDQKAKACIFFGGGGPLFFLGEYFRMMVVSMKGGQHVS